LAVELDSQIKDCFFSSNPVPHELLINEAKKLVDFATRLFDGVTDFKNKEQLHRMISNYMGIKDELIGHEPKVIRMN